jgi:hypothetical protein
MAESKDGADVFATQQSSEGTGTQTQSQEKTYTLPWVKDATGELRTLTAEEMREESLKANSEYPELRVKAQQLSELEKAKVAEATNEKDPILDELKTKYGVVTKDELETWKKEVKNETRREMSIEENLKSMEKKYDGSNGYPKFESREILTEMNNPNNPLFGKVFDPGVYFEYTRKDKIDQAKLAELNNARNTTPPDLRGAPTGGNTGTGTTKTPGTMSTDELVESAKEFGL